MSEWVIPQPVPEIEIRISNVYVWIEGAGRIAFDPEWKSSGDSPFARALPILVTQILELDLAEVQGEDLRLSFSDFSSLAENEITAFAELLERSPFSLRVKMRSFLGAPSSGFAVQFSIGSDEGTPDVRGCFCRVDDSVYLLEPQDFKLLSEIGRAHV